VSAAPLLLVGVKVTESTGRRPRIAGQSAEVKAFLTRLQESRAVAVPDDKLPGESLAPDADAQAVVGGHAYTLRAVGAAQAVPLAILEAGKHKALAVGRRTVWMKDGMLHFGIRDEDG
jgi:hypothetical protein